MTRKNRTHFFFTTDLAATGSSVTSHYAGRWSIEDTYRNVKEFLGGVCPGDVEIASWTPETYAAFSGAIADYLKRAK